MKPTTGEWIWCLVTGGAVLAGVLAVYPILGPTLLGGSVEMPLGQGSILAAYVAALGPYSVVTGLALGWLHSPFTPANEDVAGTQGNLKTPTDENEPSNPWVI